MATGYQWHKESHKYGRPCHVTVASMGGQTAVHSLKTNLHNTFFKWQMHITSSGQKTMKLQCTFTYSRALIPQCALDRSQRPVQTRQVGLEKGRESTALCHRPSEKELCVALLHPRHSQPSLGPRSSRPPWQTHPSTPELENKEVKQLQD